MAGMNEHNMAGPLLWVPLYDDFNSRTSCCEQLCPVAGSVPVLCADLSLTVGSDCPQYYLALNILHTINKMYFDNMYHRKLIFMFIHQPQMYFVCFWSALFFSFYSVLASFSVKVLSMYLQNSPIVPLWDFPIYTINVYIMGVPVS